MQLSLVLSLSLSDLIRSSEKYTVLSLLNAFIETTRRKMLHGIILRITKLSFCQLSTPYQVYVYSRVSHRTRQVYDRATEIINETICFHSKHDEKHETSSFYI